MQKNISKALLLFVILCAGVICFPSNYAQGTNEAERLLQKAILLEDVDGNLQGAIEQYKKIAADNGKNRPVAAKALLRLAGCYEKLGREEAQKTYQQLIREFPDQIELVRIAKEKLAFLEKGNTNMSLRLVWEGPEVELMGAPSPDGRFLCYTDWDTGDLAIHDLTRGENRRLTGQTKWDGNHADNSRWSPDGKLIAYTWDSPGGSDEVRVVGLDGQKPRIVFRNGSVEDWSPDGKELLVRRGWEEGFVSLVSVSDGSVRHLVKMGRADVERDHMKFSPDGKYIAYDYQNESTSRGIKFPTDKDIYILSVDEKIQIPLVKNPANDYLLGWTPDGNSILFASDRSGAVDAWILPVKDGKPAGEPRIVHKDIGAISPLGFTRDGAFFYGHGKDLLNIYIGTLDRKPQAMTATYKKLGLPFEGRNDWAEFSPDGKLLAFVRESSSSGTSSGPIRNNTLCIHDLETGKEQTFPLNLLVSRLRWAPDRSSILIGGFHEKNSFVGSIDIQTGETKAIFPADKEILEELYGSPDWSPDGRSVYCLRLVGMKEKDPQCAIIAKDLGADQIRVVHKESKPAEAISVSPDGSWLAVYGSSGTNSRQRPTESILKLISIKDGEERELCRFVNATSYPCWSTDGSYIFFTGHRAGDEKWDVWYVPVEGGEPRGLGLSLSRRTRCLSLHPDGVRFAFSSFGQTVSGPEVWVMENFLTQRR